LRFSARHAADKEQCLVIESGTLNRLALIRLAVLLAGVENDTTVRIPSCMRNADHLASFDLCHMTD
jgi:hypothetical protein